MTHLDDDTLLKSVLATLESSEEAVVRRHTAECRQCRERLEKLQGEVRRMAGVELAVGVVAPPPLPHRSPLMSQWGRAAAVLAVGFLLGYGTAQVISPVRLIPVQQKLIPARVETPLSGYTSCPAVEVAFRRPK